MLAFYNAECQQLITESETAIVIPHDIVHQEKWKLLKVLKPS
jgi:hypothetical protein